MERIESAKRVLANIAMVVVGSLFIGVVLVFVLWYLAMAIVKILLPIFAIVGIVLLCCGFYRFFR